MALDLSGDFAIFDNTEVVTYERRNISGDGMVTYLGVLGLRRAVAGSLAGQNQSTVSSARWHLDASTLPVIPRRGDRIISTTGTWEILTAGVQTFATRYACETKKV